MSVTLSITSHASSTVLLEYHTVSRETPRITVISSSSEEIPLLHESNPATIHRLRRSKFSKRGVSILLVKGDTAYLNYYTQDAASSSSIFIREDGCVLLNNEKPSSTSAVDLAEYVNGCSILTTSSLADLLERRARGKSECTIL